MNETSLLDELIEREKEYLDEQEVGTKEYNDSLKRLTELESKRAERVKFFEEKEARVEHDMIERVKNYEEKKARMQQNIIEIGKFVVGGVIIPVVGLVCITATEKDTTFTGALRDYTRLFLPKKVN